MREIKNNGLVLFLTAVILILSWMNISATRNLEHRINNMHGEFASLRSQVSHEVGQISGTVQHMREAERWWNIRDVEFLATWADEGLVRLEWQLREYSAGSQVTLNYRKRGEDTFTTIAAESESEGYFYADFMAEITHEPSFEIYITSPSKRDSVSEKMVGFESDQYQAYEYYISVKEDGKLRSSDVLSLNLDTLSRRLYNPLYIGVHLNDEIYISLNEDTFGFKESKYQVEQAFAEVRKGDAVIQRERLILNDDMIESGGQYYPEDIFYEARFDPASDYDDLYLIVNYNDDMKFELKIDLNVIGLQYNY
ncbi:hypothetical protein [Dethiobacter alkaliphilus]|uniref:Uncharacterized protein n=1 Tax=Dethiobacter alkaliphilus AHT 1 TaxID=555088 RepID=C0GDA2_DETAL|nr:hypothetical protein [Dethiobacter alkaliphilus]EEG78623.1 hypothetical protein DealDRAFT_0553 [Dethiobacter alkaliphilus AHT 1]